MTTDARSESTSISGRALLVFAIVMAVGGGSLTAYALWPSTSSADEAILEVSTVTAAAAPETIPLLPVTSAVPDDAPEPDALDTATTTTTEPEPPTRVAPSGVSIGDIDLWGPIRPVGLEENGELEVPNETEVGWYNLGASPGQAGSTVLAAHVTWNSTFGPFYNLGILEPGALIDVHLDDDTTRTYEVTERTMYDKDKLPRDRIWRTTGDETLVLITCGGSFNPEIRRYRQNIVVYAVPVA